VANVNDTNGLRRRLDRLIDRIDTADIPEADRAALADYSAWKRRRSSSINTTINYVSAVLHSSQRHDAPVTAVEDASEVEAIISAHEAAGATAAKSVNAKLDGLRDFWRWCDGQTEHGVDDYRWVELVTNVEPSPENPGPELLDPDLILGEADISRLVSGANNYRDKAFIEFLCDTGARVTLATQMKRGDVNPEAHPPTFRPNADGIAHKDVATKDYVLKESAEPIAEYLAEAHPDAHDEAPLFAVRKGYDPEARAEGAIARRSALDALARAAETAGIDRACVKPHNLRKTAVARMILRHGMSWEAIQKRMDWGDKSLPRMKEIYRRLDNSDEVELVARELGYDDDPDRTHTDAVADLSVALAEFDVEEVDDITAAVRAWGPPK